jgi:large subunit ribosomal protein L30
MKKYRIKQVKSGIGKPLRQKRTIEALGLKKMYREIEVVGTPQVLGMIAKVRHLIEVEEV